MDTIFDYWVDASGRTLSLKNITQDMSGEPAAWHALQHLGFASVAWDEDGVRVRLSAEDVDPGTVDGLIRALSAVRRPVTLEVWSDDVWHQHVYDNGKAFAAGLFAAIGITD